MINQTKKQTATINDVGIVYSDKELLEIVTDIINGEYTVRSLKKDFNEFITDIRNLKS